MKIILEYRVTSEIKFDSISSYFLIKLVSMGTLNNLIYFMGENYFILVSTVGLRCPSTHAKDSGRLMHVITEHEELMG